MQKPNLLEDKPTINADENVWGIKLNKIIDKLQTFVNSIVDVVSGKLDKGNVSNAFSTAERIEQKVKEKLDKNVYDNFKEEIDKHTLDYTQFKKEFVDGNYLRFNTTKNLEDKEGIVKDIVIENITINTINGEPYTKGSNISEEDVKKIGDKHYESKIEKKSGFNLNISSDVTSNAENIIASTKLVNQINTNLQNKIKNINIEDKIKNKVDKAQITNTVKDLKLENEKLKYKQYDGTQDIDKEIELPKSSGGSSLDYSSILSSVKKNINFTFKFFDRVTGKIYEDEIPKGVYEKIQVRDIQIDRYIKLNPDINTVYTIELTDYLAHLCLATFKKNTGYDMKDDTVYITVGSYFVDNIFGTYTKNLKINPIVEENTKEPINYLLSQNYVGKDEKFYCLCYKDTTALYYIPLSGIIKIEKDFWKEKPFYNFLLDKITKKFINNEKLGVISQIASSSTKINSFSNIEYPKDLFEISPNLIIDTNISFNSLQTQEDKQNWGRMHYGYIINVLEENFIYLILDKNRIQMNFPLYFSKVLEEDEKYKQGLSTRIYNSEKELNTNLSLLTGLTSKDVIISESSEPFNLYKYNASLHKTTLLDILALKHIKAVGSDVNIPLTSLEFIYKNLEKNIPFAKNKYSKLYDIREKKYIDLKEDSNILEDRNYYIGIVKNNPSLSEKPLELEYNSASVSKTQIYIGITGYREKDYFNYTLTPLRLQVYVIEEKSRYETVNLESLLNYQGVLMFMDSSYIYYLTQDVFITSNQHSHIYEYLNTFNLKLNTPYNIVADVDKLSNNYIKMEENSINYIQLQNYLGVILRTEEGYQITIDENRTKYINKLPLLTLPGNRIYVQDKNEPTEKTYTKNLENILKYFMPFKYDNNNHFEIYNKASKKKEILTIESVYVQDAN